MEFFFFRYLIWQTDQHGTRDYRAGARIGAVARTEIAAIVQDSKDSRDHTLLYLKGRPEPYLLPHRIEEVLKSLNALPLAGALVPRWW